MTDGDRLAAARGRRTDLRVALGRLEQTLAMPAPGREAEWLTAAGARAYDLVIALEQHFEVTEGEDGLFEEILQEAPRLAHAIDGLRHDHDRLRDQATALRDQITDSQTDPVSVDALRKQAVALMVELVEHRHRGADLVYSAFNIDIEAAD